MYVYYVYDAIFSHMNPDYQALLFNPAVGSEINTSHKSTGNMMKDFCDGSFYRASHFHISPSSTTGDNIMTLK